MASKKELLWLVASANSLPGPTPLTTWGTSIGKLTRYEGYEDEDEESSQTPSMTNSEFQRKLRSNKPLEALYKIRFTIEKIFLFRKATIYYKLMCSYGKLSIVKKTMRIFGKIFEQMKRKREKIGMVKVKRIWYFGRIHDKEMYRARKYIGSGRTLNSSQRKKLLYHNGKDKEFYFGF